MLTPPYLKTGDKIGIVATARKISNKEIEPSIKILEYWGLRVVLGKNLFKTENQFAGSDNERAQDLQTMLDDRSVKAVISARGGYGTMRIIDKINFSKFKKHPKWVVGYSDITVLHSHIHNLGIETIHATMPINFEKNKEDTELLKSFLFGLNNQVENKKSKKNLQQKKIIGEVVGGNLSLLYALIGSSSDINTNRKILFIEDLDEYLYHIDRMMISLKRAGKLKNLKALLVGSMNEMKDNAIPFGKTAEEIIRDAVKEYNYPVCFNYPSGHGEQNHPIYLGRKSALIISKEYSTLLQ